MTTRNSTVSSRSVECRNAHEKGNVACATSGASSCVSGATSGAGTGSADSGTATTSPAAVGAAGGFAILAQALSTREGDSTASGDAAGCATSGAGAGSRDSVSVPGAGGASSVGAAGELAPGELFNTPRAVGKRKSIAALPASAVGSSAAGGTDTSHDFAGGGWSANKQEPPEERSRLTPAQQCNRCVVCARNNSIDWKWK